MLRRTGRLSGTGWGQFAALVLFALLALGLGVPSLAASSAGPARVPKAERAAESVERHKVLVMIGARTTDERTLERMHEKLDVLSGRKLRLAAALCERMARDEGSAGADLAFSLVTALIVLS